MIYEQDTDDHQTLVILFDTEETRPDKGYGTIKGKAFIGEAEFFLHLMNMRPLVPYKNLKENL